MDAGRRMSEPGGKMFNLQRAGSIVTGQGLKWEQHSKSKKKPHTSLEVCLWNGHKRAER